MTTPVTNIQERLLAVRACIQAACERAGRDPASVTLVGVSKTHPVETLRQAARAGLTDLGENRAQEFVPKARAFATPGGTAAALSPTPHLPTWHFIGHLQRNKVRDVLPHVDVLHSVDSVRLIEELERRFEARADGSALPCFLEVNVAGEASKQGVTPEVLPELLRRAQASPVLSVQGLMTVAPRVDRAEEVRPVFRALHGLAAAHGLDALSMGMTDDFEVAIEEGATVVRVGRAIFRNRA